MPRAAVVGTPITHSLSPVLHRAAYQALVLSDWSYEKIECAEAELSDVVAGLDDEWRGLSVTMPGKRVALQLATSASELARSVGAANTLVRRSDGWYADNTDVAGVVGALHAVGVTSVAGAVVLGAGGTAGAVLAALRVMGETAPTVLVREPARAGALRDAAERLGLEPRIVRGIGDSALYAAPVVVSTLPKGAADAVADGPWTSDGVVFDVTYDPWPSPLASAARSAGRMIVSGLDMLLYQAVDQVKLMTGREAPVDAMRSALSAATGVEVN